MKSLIEYIHEKLVINKDFVGRTSGKDIKSMSDVAHEIETIVNDELGAKDQIKLPDHFYCNWDIRREMCDSLKDNINTEVADYYDEKWFDNISFVFKLRGIPKARFYVSFIENDFFIMYVDDISAKIRNIITDLMKEKDVDVHIKDNGRQQWGQHKKIPSTYFWTAFNIKYTYYDLVNMMCDFIAELLEALDISVVNREKKPGEVVPGWTIDDIKKRYDKIFDDIRIMRSGNISLGRLREPGPYDTSKFRIDVDINYRNGIMIGRRKDNSSSSGNNFVLEPTVDKAFDALDAKLRKKGYTI